jgi:signal peptidase I
MKKSLIGFVETFVVGLVLSVLIMVFAGQSLEITGDSMYPTLKNDERIVVEKVTYKSRAPKRGEIVVIRSLQNDAIFLIKRVVAIPGDRINISPIGEVYATHASENLEYDEGKAQNLGVLAKYSETPIPDNYFIVMGDNRNESFDSRMFGLVPFDNFVGKAFVVYWPPAEIRII